MTDFVAPYAPSYGATKTIDFRVLENGFGDGYEQIVPDGMNNVKETWNLMWGNCDKATADDIQTQLVALQGTRFGWATPDADYKTFRCGKVERAFVGWNNYTVAVVFTETF